MIENIVPIDNPRQDPNFIPIDLTYPGLRQVSLDPPIYLIDDFLTADKCISLIDQTENTSALVRSPVVGKGNGVVSNDRTSDTCFIRREDVPTLMENVSRFLLGKSAQEIELPQIGRYFPSQEYRPHYDAFLMTDEDARRFAENGGQRLATVLVYLNDCPNGGCTEFTRLDLRVHPRQGTALVFFPADINGTLDERALHAGCPAITTKYVCQIWVRESAFTAVSQIQLQNPI